MTVRSSETCSSAVSTACSSGISTITSGRLLFQVTCALFTALNSFAALDDLKESLVKQDYIRYRGGGIPHSTIGKQCHPGVHPPVNIIRKPLHIMANLYHGNGKHIKNTRYSISRNVFR